MSSMKVAISIQVISTQGYSSERVAEYEVTQGGADTLHEAHTLVAELADTATGVILTQVEKLERTERAAKRDAEREAARTESDSQY